MAKSNTAPPAPKSSVLNPTLEQGMPNFDEWSDEQIGFAPYWKPQEGKWFFGAPIAIDARDPKFIRYLFLAGADTPCRRGPADEDDETGENVMVKKGETFSLSVYYSLKHLFEEYLVYSESTEKAVYVRVDALKTVPTKNQPKVWQFRARVSPEQKKMLSTWRDENPKFLTAGSTERPQVQA